MQGTTLGLHVNEGFQVCVLNRTQSQTHTHTHTHTHTPWHGEADHLESISFEMVDVMSDSQGEVMS